MACSCAIGKGGAEESWRAAEVGKYIVSRFWSRSRRPGRVHSAHMGDIRRVSIFGCWDDDVKRHAVSEDCGTLKYHGYQAL